MTKVKIDSVTPAVGKSGKSYQKVVYNGSLQASSFDSDFMPFVGKEVDVELETKGQYTNIKLLPNYANPAKNPNVAAEPAHKEINDVDIRKSAYLLTVEKFKNSGKTLDSPVFWTEVVNAATYIKTGVTPNAPAQDQK